MSSRLVWEPVSRPKQTLSTEMKFLLRKSFREPIDAILVSDCIPYLRGVKDTAGDTDLAKEAAILIEAIEKFGEIHLKEE